MFRNLINISRGTGGQRFREVIVKNAHIAMYQRERKREDSEKNRGGRGQRRDQEAKEAGKKESSEAVTSVRDSSHGISHNASRSLRCTGCSSSGTDRAPVPPVPPLPPPPVAHYADARPLLSTLTSRSRSSVLHVVVSGCSRPPDLSTGTSNCQLRQLLRYSYTKR